MEFLGPIDINFSVYNDSAIQALGTFVIPLVSPINSCRHDTKFYVAQYSRGVLFSCEDSLYLQLIQPHPVLSKHAPHEANIISSKHDLAYINVVTRNKQASHYQPKQSSVPLQKTTCIPEANEQVPQLSRRLRRNILISLMGWVNSLVNHATPTSAQKYPQNRSHADLCLFTTKRNSRNS